VTQRRAQAERARRRLLDAALAEFSVRHFDQVTTSDIAEAAGLAQGLLFHYFGNKRGIYVEVLREAALRVGAAATSDTDTGPAGDRFRRMIRAHLTYLGDNRDFALRLILGGGGGDPEAREIFDQARWHTIEWTCALFDLDSSRPAVRLMLRSCQGSLDEATAFWLTNDHPFAVEQMVEIVVEMLITSLRCAVRLDPGLDISTAISALADSGARGATEATRGNQT
jgi:AcrR family transcriptional regulator